MALYHIENNEKWYWKLDFTAFENTFHGYALHEASFCVSPHTIPHTFYLTKVFILRLIHFTTLNHYYTNTLLHYHVTTLTLYLTKLLHPVPTSTLYYIKPLTRYHVNTLSLYRIKVLSCIPIFITLNRYTLNH